MATTTAPFCLAASQECEAVNRQALNSTAIRTATWQRLPLISNLPAQDKDQERPSDSQESPHIKELHKSGSDLLGLRTTRSPAAPRSLTGHISSGSKLSCPLVSQSDQTHKKHLVGQHTTEEKAFLPMKLRDE